MPKIIEARKAKGLTQEQLAKILGVTQGAVSQWEKGISHPSYEMLPKVAAALEITLDELIGADPDQLADERQGA